MSSFRYGCSQLPAYQIQLCLSFKARSYQCQNCIKVSQNVQDALERSKLFSCEQGTTNYEKITRNRINKVGEKIEDREIKATSRNLIIHGMVEDVKDTQEGREREDKLFVSNIM